MDAAFAPVDQDWSAVSPRLCEMRRFLTIGSLAVCGGGLVVLCALVDLIVAAAALAGAVLLVGVLCWRLIGRNYRSWRYVERAEDLLISHGVLFRELVVVPYGRMQFVDVKAGPLERRFGIATVQLHTAAAATDARIRGVVPAEAARLRDRLAALGEARSAGL
jgi:membrane protein YdbS with pleckstrin-like domain